MVENKRYTEPDMVTIETWQHFSAKNCNPGWGDYLEANEHIARELRKKIETAKDFESLKNELLNFCAEREAFAAHGWANAP